MYFIEHLTLRVWAGWVLPRLLRDRVKGRHGGRCYVFDASRPAMMAARMSSWLTGVLVERLRYRFVDVRDEQGLVLGLRVIYQDVTEVQAEVANNPMFRSVVSNGAGTERLPTYLRKAFTTIGSSSLPSFCRALFVIQVCAWKVRGTLPGGQRPIVFLDQQPWMEAIVRYGLRSSVIVIPVGRPFKLHAWLRRQLTPELRVWGWTVKAYWRLFRPWSVLRLPGRFQRERKRILTSEDGVAELGACRLRPRIGVHYRGDWNLKSPERHSDLFFWQQSSLAGRDLVVVFEDPWHPLDGPKWNELTECGMAGIALSARAATLSTAPVFMYRPQRKHGERPPLALPSRGVEAVWLRDQVFEYLAVRNYWADFFAASGIKVFTTWFKYDPTHCAMADALKQVGGLMAMYQRSYESAPSPRTAVATDLFFGFSKWGVEIERRSTSVISYYVTTGYLSDHRFPLLQETTQRVRQRLQQQGAQRILGYCDETSHPDERWHTGPAFMREDYVFLLEKVLSEPWLGLVVKPKTPINLRARLGSVARLLERAEATGRCVVFEEGTVHSSIPPAAAALASDVMIHGHLHAGTAGAEGALAGVPTLLLDREGWSISPLHKLGGQVVFTDWETLWKACLEHWRRPGGVPGFGDWSLMLDELDPFRDGRAAQRMGTYLTWLLDGFKAGKDRETVMADAAERYGAIWGRDKITTVNTSHPNRPEADACLVDSDAVGV
ncbi:MAG: hypothetical protein Q8R91_03165 [Candidatus Omnitrophota bacterium]|nr:hypothetical protein [Candidatus Omnitrophota bacterium]